MSKFATLDSMANANQGYLQTSQVIAAGISKPTLAAYTKSRNMDRVAHGLYRTQEAWVDLLYQLGATNSRIVFSHETALQLNELTEREPSIISVTVPAGYNATHLRKQGLKVYQVSSSVYPIGISEAQTVFNHAVRSYNAERTLCDILLRKDSMDIQVFRFAIQKYFLDNGPNLPRLFSYAKAFNIEPLVRTYTEVLL